MGPTEKDQRFLRRAEVKPTKMKDEIYVCAKFCLLYTLLYFNLILQILINSEFSLTIGP